MKLLIMCVALITVSAQCARDPFSLSTTVTTSKTKVKEHKEHSVHQIYSLKNGLWNEKFKFQVRAFWDELCAQLCSTKTRRYFAADEATRQFFFGGPKELVQTFLAYLASIDKKVTQVRIEARIVLADKRFEESLGIQWSGVYDQSKSIRNGFNFASIGKPVRGSLSSCGEHDASFHLFPSSWLSKASSHLPLIFGGPNLATRRLNIMLNAAESKNRIKTILKPTIVTRDKHMAEILEGEVIPIESIVEENVEGSVRHVRTATYKDVGVQLRVKPDVNRTTKRITLDLFIENSMVAPCAASSSKKSHSANYPTIITTRSKTNVTLASGQTTMISGLIKNRRHKEKTSVPFLSKIPLLGWLFKGKRRVKSDMQLFIFITPTIDQGV